MIEIIAGAIGSGLAATAFFFPVTYLAMKKQYQLMPEKQLLRPLLISWFSISALHLFGIGFSSHDESWVGMMTFIIMPIVISAVVLLKTGRLPIAQTDRGR